MLYRPHDIYCNIDQPWLRPVNCRQQEVQTGRFYKTLLVSVDNTATVAKHPKKKKNNFFFLFTNAGDMCVAAVCHHRLAGAHEIFTMRRCWARGAEMKNIFMPERCELRNMAFTRQAAVFVSARHGNRGGGENTAKRSGDVFTVRRPARSESQIQLFISSCLGSFQLPLAELELCEASQNQAHSSY